MVASNIAYKGVSPSFTLPTSNSSSTWSIRATGTTTTIGGGSGSQASSLGNQRVYTVIARGYRSITTTSDPRYAKISLIFNQ
jgi:hypothetical protein